MHKICKSINFHAKEWHDYCNWRKRQFTEFKSLDSTLQNSIFTPQLDHDWNFAVNTGNFLTDVVNDLNFAKSYCVRQDAQIILSFDFIDNADPNRQTIGFDILDGALDYSLLTNFGNDISIVNKYLDTSGLISSREDVIKVHQWFLSEMPNDGHVHGSKICAVYPEIETPKK